MKHNINTKIKNLLFKKLNKTALFCLITSATPSLQSMKQLKDDFQKEMTILRPELLELKDDYSSYLTPKKYIVPKLNLQNLPNSEEEQNIKNNDLYNNSQFAIFQAMWQKKPKILRKLLSDDNLKKTFSTYQDENGFLAFTTLKLAISQKKPLKYVTILTSNISYSKEQITEAIKYLTEYITLLETYRPTNNKKKTVRYLQNILEEKTQEEQIQK